jgi:hypothetical protein
MVHMTLESALGLETWDLGFIPMIAGCALVCWWARRRPTGLGRFGAYVVGGVVLVLGAAVVAGSIMAGQCSPGDECDLTLVAASVWAFWAIVMMFVGVAVNEFLLHRARRRGPTDTAVEVDSTR